MYAAASQMNMFIYHRTPRQLAGLLMCYQHSPEDKAARLVFLRLSVSGLNRHTGVCALCVCRGTMVG